MRTLVTVPSLDKPGGVANYYRSLRKYLPDGIEYFTVGAQYDNEGLRKNIVRFLKDYGNYYRQLKHGDYDLVHLNPSLVPKAIIRDGIFLLIANAFQIKVIVFIRGWDLRFERLVRKYYLPVFRFVYWKADAFIVLGTEFHKKLVEMGCTKQILIETTLADDAIFSQQACNTMPDVGTNKKFNILMLTRIEKAKGVYEAVDAYRILKKKIPSLTLTIAGDGPELQAITKYVSDQHVEDVAFPGFLTGKLKQAVFEQANIFLFPTSYAEGMPNAILEAMAYGLPVVTRPVGGIRDFFEDGRMGFITESLDPGVFSSFLENLILDNELRMKIGAFNRDYARDNFMASKVAKRLQGVYYKVLADATAH